MIASTDVLMVVLVAEVAGPGFTADAVSVVEGAVLVATPVTPIKEERMLPGNMRAKLMVHLRKGGIADIGEVRHQLGPHGGKLHDQRRQADRQRGRVRATEQATTGGGHA